MSVASVRDVIDPAAWDEAVWDQRKGNVFASWMWGQYKARVGWKVRRIAILDEKGEPLAYVQYQERRRAFVRLVHIQGGPLLTPRGERQGETVVKRLIDHLALGRFDLVAVNSERFETAAGTLALLARGFIPIVARGCHTFELDLTQGYDAILAAADPQWRKTLRRAERTSDLTVHCPATIAGRLAAFDAFAAMYDALKKRKGFGNTFDCHAYRDLIAGDPHHLILEVRARGEIAVVQIAHLSAERCTGFFTASSHRARANGATVLSLSRLAERAIAHGCGVFDLGGIDPGRNRGVFDFKRKLSRNVVQGSPLWLYGRSVVLRNLVGAVLVLR